MYEEITFCKCISIGIGRSLSCADMPAARACAHERARLWTSVTESVVLPSRLRSARARRSLHKCHGRNEDVAQHICDLRPTYRR